MHLCRENSLQTRLSSTQQQPPLKRLVTLLTSYATQASARFVQSSCEVMTRADYNNFDYSLNDHNNSRNMTRILKDDPWKGIVAPFDWTENSRDIGGPMAFRKF